MQCLVEILGPQHAGKTTVAELVSLLLEEHAILTLRVETDNSIYNFFPVYTKLRATGQGQRAHDLLSQRWTLISSMVSSSGRTGLGNCYTVIHNHLNTCTYKLGVDLTISKGTHSE